MGSRDGWQSWVGTDQEWDSIRFRLGATNVFQGSKWAEFKREEGWHAKRLVYLHDSSPLTAIQLLHKLPLPRVSVFWSPGGASGNNEYFSKDFVTQLLSRHGTINHIRVGFQSPFTHEAASRLSQIGFQHSEFALTPDISLHYFLNQTESQKMDSLHPNWRRNLKRSTKYEPKAYYWREPDPESISLLMKEVVNFKGLRSSQIPWNLARITRLINCFKESIAFVRCDDADGKLVSIRAALIDGETSWDIIAGTGESGRKSYSSYATFWKLTEVLSDLGVKVYDLAGIDPVANKGVSDFKRGTGATEIKYLGEWDLTRPNVFSRLMKTTIKNRLSQ